MVTSRYYELDEVFDNAGQPGTMGKVATQLMHQHQHVMSREMPLVLECGVHKGRSTGILAHACEHQNGRLVSVDIDDCADVIESPVWTFVQQDDSDQESLFKKVPELRDGLDLLYIDSLHVASHVQILLMQWYPYMKQGSVIAVDDIDPFPYMRGQRKDDITREIAWRAIGDVVTDFFYANHETLLLEMHYGSTGQAILRKLSPLGTAPLPPIAIPRRRMSIKTVARSILSPFMKN